MDNTDVNAAAVNIAFDFITISFLVPPFGGL